MNFARYAIALILTIALLGIARRISTRHSSEYHIQAGNLTATHHTVTEDFGEGPVLDVKVAPADGLTPVAFYAQDERGPYKADTMVQTSDGFTAALPVLQKGNKWYYHIDLLKNGETIGKFPPYGDQFIKFKGHVPAYILIPHIFCMFATVYFGLLAVLSAVDAVKGKGEVKKSIRYSLWTVIVSFIGGFPLGYLVAYMAFGVGWSGIPLGWDITDNKTVILFLFWLVTFFLARKGLKGERMAISDGLYVALTIVSLAVTILAFMVPHSI